MNHSTFNYKKSAAFAALLAFIALGLAGWIGQSLTHQGVLDIQSGFLLQGFIMSGIIIPGIWLIRKYVDHQRPIDLGTNGKKPPLSLFLLGSAIVIAPMAAALSISSIMGWAELEFHLHTESLMPVFIGLITVILFESLPEELVFRGYIYGALRTSHSKWISAIISVIGFVLLPSLLVPVQKYILGMDISIGGASALTGGYLVVMLLFGSFMMFLRIISGSIWITIGFHTFFVFVDRLISPTENSIIQMLENGNQTATQITLMVCYLVVIALIISKWLLTRNRLVTS